MLMRVKHTQTKYVLFIWNKCTELIYAMARVVLPNKPIPSLVEHHLAC